MEEQTGFLRLRKLEAVNNGLTAKDVVEDAEDPTSPLHEFFEWNDARAASEYRLTQARELIRRYEITFTKAEGVGRVRAFFFVPSAGKYRSAESVASNKSMSDEVLGEMRKEVAQLATRTRAFEQFIPEAKAIADHLESTPFIGAQPAIL